jgi:heterotetrameric sarcosine oxidase gamma subunit
VSVPDSGSVPNSGSVPGAAVGLSCASLPADIIELAALRDRTHVLRALGARRGLSFPEFGRIAMTRETVVLCTRPERWLVLTTPAPPGVAFSHWSEACAGCAAPVELSAALTVLYLAGSAVREVLARGCRLDLHPDAFTAGSAAATHMAQVSVTLAALPAGWLLLTPATTARHFREWLTSTAGPFGLAARADATVATLSGEMTT